MRPWLTAAAVLLVELAALGVRYDADVVARFDDGLLHQLLAGAGTIPQIGVAVATATVLLLARHRGAPVLADTGPRPVTVVAATLAHVVGFTTFWLITATVLETPSGATAAALLAWLAAGVVVVVSLLAACVPVDALRGMLARARRVAPLAVTLGAAAWAAGELSATSWHGLQESTLRWVYAALGPFAADAFASVPDLAVGTSRFHVTIAPECSGYQGVGMTAVFTGVYLWVFRDRLRFPAALILLPVGVAAALALNVARITTLILIGAHVSPAVAVGGFHSYAGSLLFCLLALGLAHCGSRWRVLQRARAEEVNATGATADASPTAAYLAPLLAIFTATLVGGSLSADGGELAYPLRVAAGAAALWLFRHGYRDLRVTWSWRAVTAGVLVFIAWSVSEPQPAHAAAVAFATPSTLGPVLAPVWIALRVLGTSITVPLAEELAFRGYLARRLQSSRFMSVPVADVRIAAIIASSAAFGLMHERIVAATLAGIVYALVARRRGELTDAVLAHATTNALLAAQLLITN